MLVQNRELSTNDDIFPENEHYIKKFLEENFDSENRELSTNDAISQENDAGQSSETRSLTGKILDTSLQIDGRRRWRRGRGREDPTIITDYSETKSLMQMELQTTTGTTTTGTKEVQENTAHHHW